MVGLHWGVLTAILEEDTGETYDKRTWMIKFIKDEFMNAKLKAKEKILARMFFVKSDKGRYGPMLAKLKNDKISGLNTYPMNRVAAFALLNNWDTTYERRVSSSSSNFGTSFNQNGGMITCWGCGTSGIILLECKNEECVKKYKARMSKRKASSISKVEQHFNIKTNKYLPSESEDFSTLFESVE
jgi:hypothetical protein